MATHNDLGQWGERAASAYLTEKGYEILARNWRFKNLEIDLVALKDSVLVVVEVKTRTSTGFGLPQDFVTKAKIKRLVQAANQYALTNQRHEEIRFDIIAVVKIQNQIQIEHLEDAFYPF
ncbi:YraN family protein [Flavobacterium sp. JP2137]|uniref:YraN family protein n=1 Tax=Flavobacterium sp. JP2137 TaxID=3414510 RepID=UPI003D2FBD55